MGLSTIVHQMHHSPSAEEVTVDHLKYVYPSQYASEVMAWVVGTHPVPVNMGFHLNETLKHDKAVRVSGAVHMFMAGEAAS